MLSVAIGEDVEVSEAERQAKKKLKKGLQPLVGKFPEPKANCVSRFSFHYLGPLLDLGSKRPLKHDDLWELPEEESIEKLIQGFEAAQQKVEHNRTENDKFQLGKILWTQFSPTIILAGAFMLVHVVAQISGPLLIREVVLAVSEPSDTDPYRGLYLACLYLAVQVINAICAQQHLHNNIRAGQRIRALLIALIYRKAMKLRILDMGAESHGQIVNLMSNDAQKFFDIMQSLHNIWAAPIQIILAAGFLIWLLSWPAVMGIIVVALMVPINAGFASCGAKIRRAHMGWTDKRVRLNSEMLGGMRIIKMFSWELPFIRMVLKLRNKEMSYIFKELAIFASFISVLIIVPVLGVMTTFTVFVAVGNVLTADIAFSALVLFIWNDMYTQSVLLFC
jgi:ATP-binding cassette subfamily C (CFTR/MRP) protein 1